MSKVQINCCLKLIFQKVDQNTGGKWLIHDTKHSEATVEYACCENKSDMKGSDVRWQYYLIFQTNAYSPLLNRHGWIRDIFVEDIVFRICPS